FAGGFVHVEDRDLHALRGERAGGGLAQAGSGAGDHGRNRTVEFHGRFPPVRGKMVKKRAPLGPARSAEGVAVTIRNANQSGAADAFAPRSPIDPAGALVPAVQRVNEIRVRTGFWPKLRRVAARIPFANELVSIWYCARDPQTPTAAKGMMLAGLAYFVLP